MVAYRRLPLEGLSNARDMGGYPLPGGHTNYGVFIRSEIPAFLTDSDIAFLREYGVSTDIDLRSDAELEKMPDALRELDFMRYIHLPMFDEAAVRGAGKEFKIEMDKDFTWASQYIAMTERSKDWYRDVLCAIADAPGAVLFHCTTGKDRTGMIAACLLGICGVSDMDIIADYCVSQVYLQEMYRQMSKMFPRDTPDIPLNDPFFSTSPENMEKFLGYINQSYGSVEGFLRGCDVPLGVLDQIRDRFS